MAVSNNIVLITGKPDYVGIFIDGSILKPLSQVQTAGLGMRQ